MAKKLPVCTRAQVAERLSGLGFNCTEESVKKLCEYVSKWGDCVITSHDNDEAKIRESKNKNQPGFVFTIDEEQVLVINPTDDLS